MFRNNYYTNIAIEIGQIDVFESVINFSISNASKKLHALDNLAWEIAVRQNSHEYKHELNTSIVLNSMY